MANEQVIVLPKDFFKRFGRETVMLYIALAGECDDEGVCTASDRSLASALGVTRSQVRKSIGELVENQLVTTAQPQCNHSATTYCINKSIDYGTRKTKKQPRSNHSTTTEQPEVVVFEEQKKSDLDVRKQDFYNTLVPFVFDQNTGSGYNPEMLRAFFDYWSEPNQAGTKMRFELQKTWSVEGRLRTWASRDNNFNNRNNGTELNTKAQREFEAICADTARGIARRSKIVLSDDLI